METVEVINRKENSYSEKPNNSDTISRHAAIRWIKTECNPYGKPTLDYETSCRIMEHLDKMPSAQPDYQEILGWLLAYHTMSFDLHGRYLPHEVISWLINDFTKEFITERGQNG